LDQINKDNIKDLRIVWRWKQENFGPRPEFNFEATPLMVHGVLYETAGNRRVAVAIDGATGETLWMFRLDEGERGQKAAPLAPSGRGLAYWTNGTEERVLYVTRGYQLVALDAKSGRPVPTFGKGGVVDLKEQFDQEMTDGQITDNSPPLVVGNVVVVGTASPPAASVPTMTWPKGHVRGYDVVTGKRLWIFHTIPSPGEVGNETWEKDSWSFNGAAAVWGPMSADEELGYVYMSVDMPTNDFYGGHRPGNGLFADSLVCVDAKTGRRIWHFQAVHHDVWDYDLIPTASLVDVTVNGKKIKAVAQVSKGGFIYVFDRVTGAPMWPIVERPVPQSDVPGEKSSPTQPFPTKPAPFEMQGTSVDDLIDFTPELRAEALKIVSQYKLGPMFSPPIVLGSNGFRAALVRPSERGGANWFGAAVDPETGLIYIPSMNMASPIGLIHDAKRTGTMDQYINGPVGLYLDGPQGLPLFKPPWGRITAIDLNTGDHVWMKANADTPEFVKNHPALKGVALPKMLGSGNISGLLLTKTLLFAGEAADFYGPSWGGGKMFRAFDKKTGDVVWETQLPGGLTQTGNPMTYMIDGKQYVVIPAGAKGVAGELIAYSLP
jgi:quinoprotein glucose dehydrogenase